MPSVAKEIALLLEQHRKEASVSSLKAKKAKTSAQPNEATPETTDTPEVGDTSTQRMNSLQGKVSYSRQLIKELTEILAEARRETDEAHSSIEELKTMCEDLVATQAKLITAQSLLKIAARKQEALLAGLLEVAAETQGTREPEKRLRRSVNSLFDTLRNTA